MKENVLCVLGLSAGLLFSGGAWAQGQASAAAAGQATAQAPLSATVHASGCWIRQIPAPAPSGGFFVLRNTGDKDVVLQGASSPDYGMVMLHETRMDKGMSRMSMVHQVQVPARGELDFKPGGYHVMLEQPRAGLKVGDSIRLDLILGNGEQVSTQCEIRPAKALSGGHMSGPASHPGSAQPGMPGHMHGSSNNGQS
jgi:copper(I)-binding protein